MTEAATLKIGDLARRTGVSVPTIHFYLREGLLPAAPRKTSRNMAYYDESYVARIRLIRRLQDERRLPLRVIRSLLAETEGSGEEVLDLVEVQARVLPALELPAGGEELGRDELVARTGIDPRDLDDLEQMAVVTPRGAGRRARYDAGDVAIADAVGRLRALGITRELFPAGDLALYQRAMSALVGEEARLFARRMRAADVAFGGRMEAAIRSIGDLIVRLRQKLIQDLVDGLRAGAAQPAHPGKRGAAPARSAAAVSRARKRR
ncbi:MAG: MerR family transcriptional regulator [Polyangiaceae bacterium]|nr:MerR family transcriptional regulator [Polyangiaceae bacterium]